MTYKIKSKGKDYWGRNTYEDISTKKVFKEVDGKLHYVTKAGEPLSPVHAKFEIIKEKPKEKKKRGTLFMLESEKGEAVRIDEYGNKEYMVKGSGGSKWIDKETGEIRE